MLAYKKGHRYSKVYITKSLLFRRESEPCSLLIPGCSLFLRTLASGSF